MSKEEKLGLPENLQSTAKAGFIVMRAFMVDRFGEAYVTKLIRAAKESFVKQAIFGWEPDDGNTVVDVSPMPDPWRGQWGYRIRFCAVRSDDDITISQFYVPSSALKKRDDAAKILLN
jgi:hypothetical protein